MANESPNCPSLILNGDGHTIVVSFSTSRSNIATPKIKSTTRYIILASKVLGSMGLKICSLGIFQIK